MNNRWNRFLSLLLALCTVLTMIPAAFALETTEELPQDPGTGEEEVVAVEDIDADAGIMPAATFVPDGSSDTEYPAITVTGTSHGSKATELLDLLNQARAENASTILIRSATATEVASAMAAEYIYGSDIIRATGEDWSTLAGDKELEINEGTSPLLAFVVTEEADAELAMECFASSYTEILDSTAYNNAGIGCFELKDGSVYWAMLLYSGTEYKDSVALGDSSASYDVPFDAESICAYMDFDLDDYDLNMGESFTLNVIMDNGYDKIVIPASELTYETSDAKIVSLTSAGKLSAIGTGDVVVTATLKSDESLTVSANLTSTLNMIAPEVKVANAVKGVQISWTASPGATHYLVFRSTRIGNWSGSVSYQVPVSQTSYIDTTAVSGTTYYYTVRPGRLVSGKWTYGAFNTTGVANTYVTAPTLYNAKASSDGITVTWKAVSGANQYHVYRKGGKDTNWVRLASFGSGYTSYVDVNVTSGTKYTYTVRASKGSALSGFSTSGVSATASTTVKTNPYIVLSNTTYRSGVGTSSKAIGTLKAGTRVNVVAGWSRKANGLTWFKFNANGQFFYLPSTNLLGKLQLSNVTNVAGGAQVSWKALTNSAGYAVYRMAEGEETWTHLGNVKAGVTTYTDSSANLTSGVKYTYTVRGYKGAYASDFDAKGVTLTFVKTPALVSAAATNNSVVFKWEEVAGVDGYFVYRKENNGSWSRVATIKNSATTTYTDTNVTTAVQYTYTVRAYIGNVMSYFVTSGVSDIPFAAGTLTTCTVLSDTKYRTGAGTGYSTDGTLKSGARVNVLTSDLNSASASWCRVVISGKNGKVLRYVPKTALFATPKLKNIVIRGTGLQVYWNKVAGATAYGIWRKTDTTNWVRIATVGSGVTNYTDNSTATGTVYYYTVRAYQGSVLSWFDTAGIKSIFLSLPNLTNTTSNDKGITVEWSHVEGAAGYYVYRRTANSSWTAVGQVKSGDTHSLKDTKNLIKGTTYYYTVRAYNGSALSWFDTTGRAATATANLNLATVKYTVKVTSAPYYKLDASGQVLASGVQSTTLKKGDVIEVLSGLPVVEDTYSTGVTYTPFQKGDAVYYIRTSYIEKA